MPLIGRLLNNSDFFLRQPVQIIHQPINLAVGGVDLALEDVAVIIP